jgi:hypothetical protein
MEKEIVNKSIVVGICAGISQFLPVYVFIDYNQDELMHGVENVPARWLAVGGGDRMVSRSLVVGICSRESAYVCVSVFIDYNQDEVAATNVPAC